MVVALAGHGGGVPSLAYEARPAHHFNPWRGNMSLNFFNVWLIAAGFYILQWMGVSVQDAAVISACEVVLLLLGE